VGEGAASPGDAARYPPAAIRLERVLCAWLLVGSRQQRDRESGEKSVATGRSVSVGNPLWADNQSYVLGDASWHAESATLRAALTSDRLARYDFGRCPATRLCLELTGVPLAGPGLRTVVQQIRLDISTCLRRVEVNVMPGHLVDLVISGADEDSLSIQVEVEDNAPRPEFQLSTTSGLARLQITRCNVKLSRTSIEQSTHATPNVARVVCDNSGFQYPAGSSGRIDIRGKCVVDLGDSRDTNVFVAPGAQLRLKTKRRIGKLRSFARVDGPNATSSANRFTIRSGSFATFRSVKAVAFNLEPDAVVTADEVESSSIGGPGRIHVTREAIELALGPVAPWLEVGQHARVEGVEGPAKIHGHGHSLIAGIRPAGDLRGVDGSAALRIEDVHMERDVSPDGISLVNATFPVSRSGLRVISQLANSAHVEPLPHRGLPGRPLIHGGWGSGGELQLENEYARALAELAANKGARASTRTYLAACAYRMRQRSAGWMERQVLRSYALLGYGERVLAPLLTFLSIAAIMTWLGYVTQGQTRLDVTEARDWLATYSDWSTSPLHILRLTSPADGPAQFEQPWDTVARLAVALPFAMTALAIRNYVKEDYRKSRASDN
jgi:hypothetical protein